MGEFVSTIVKNALQTNPETAQQNKTGGSGQSFKQVMQDVENNQQDAVKNASPANGEIAPVRNEATVRPLDSRAEAISRDLTARMQGEKPPSPEALNTQVVNDVTKSDVLTEFLHGKNRVSYMKEAAAHNVDLKGNGQFLSRLSQAEKEFQSLDNILRSGKEFSQGELIGMQMRLYQVSQHIEIMSKIVDQMTGGVKTILNTNI